jgi:uncharacterized membrane protein (DUF2068 family)
MDPQLNESIASRPPTARQRKRLSGGFIAVIVFKYLKAAAFLLVGVVVLRFVHITRNGAPMELARFLNANAERESIRRLSTFFDGITTGQREAIGVSALAIGAVFAAEASLLLARIWWATYFTIFLTLLGIPLELGEIWRQPRYQRGWIFLVINIAILIFLWRRRNEFRDDFGSAAAASPD